ncbi:MAG: ABC transporter ATP-binding protein [Gammaproteobacteria bacterium]|nr:ABC transporter ATP-binding protein [Gammaproteobacteria bacterium]
MLFETRLWQFTRGVRLRIGAAVAMGVGASLVGIGRLALLGWLLALVFAGAALFEMLLPLALVAAVMLLRGWVEHSRAMLAHRTAARVQFALRERLYARVVALGPSHFGLTRTGSVMISMIDGVEQLETYFGQYLPQLLVAVVTPLVVFAFVAAFDLPVAALMFAFALFTLFAPVAFQRREATSSMRRSLAYRAFAAEFLDAIQGLATLKAFGQSSARGRLLAERAHEVFRSTMWVLASNAATRGLTDTGIAVGSAAVLALGAWRVTQGQMSLELLLVVLMMGIEVFRPQRDLRALLHNGMMGRAAADDIFALLDARAAVKSPATPVVLDAPLVPVVEFEDVSFAYPGARRPAHRGLSFRVAPGQRVGFVGESGAGKSTIVRLLLRFHDPGSGAVLLGGHNVRDLSADDIYRNVAVVNQDTYLFHGTVEENLRFGKPDATADELKAAARAANAHEFIERLPQGYGTVIGERGIRLSGGQRQRVAIARALLRDAPILVLDEALSAVDAENEAVIQSALDRLMQGRTTLIFAHRLSSVIDADRILVLDHGAIVESGDHAALMRAGGAYRRLMGSQAEEIGRQQMAGGAVGDGLVPSRDGFGRGHDEPVPYEDLLADDAGAQLEPTDAILRAEGLGWIGAFRELLRHVIPWRAKFSVVLAFGIARVAALIGVGVASALAVAAVKRGEPFAEHLIVLAIVAPLAGLLHWLESWFAHDMAFRMLAEMRIALFRKLDRLAPAYLVRRRTGDLVGMATHDVELVEYFFAHTVAPFFVAVLVPTAVLGTLAWFGWPMALALAPFLVLVAASPVLARRRIDSLGSRAREAFGDMNAHAVDTIQGLSEILAFQRKKARGEEFVARIERHVSLRLPFHSSLTKQTALLEVATGLGGLVVVATGASLVASEALAPAMLPMLTLLAMSAFLPVSEIAHIGRQLADTLGATRRLHAVHSEAEAVVDGPGVSEQRDGDRPGTGGIEIEARDVRFSYFGNRRLALDGATFTAAAGSTLALVGPSGAGKTTIAHLLMRFWDPDAGTIRFDGHDLRDYRLDDLREKVALVTQDTYLFNESLRANILIAKPDATSAELDEAVRRASLGPFIDALPEGLATPVGERGVRLSGGQRQRVAIARAFLKDAAVLILDEATSHLDAVNEQAVRQSLAELMSQRTTIVIAHRLSTVRDADRIVVLDAGRTVETGSHEELLARGGLYSRLVRRQMATADGESADPTVPWNAEAAD